MVERSDAVVKSGYVQLIGVVAIFAAWAALLAQLYMARSHAGDLVPLIVGARFVEAGHGEMLYQRFPDLLLVVNQSWALEAAKLGYSGNLYPYVYPPLAAYILVPIADWDFLLLKQVFFGLNLVALAVTIYLCARKWAPDFLRPLPLALLLVAFALSRTLRSELIVLNIQPLIVLAVVAAMLASQRNKPIAAGSALALAAAIKLTPAILLIYWLAAGRYRCAAWFFIVSAALLGTGMAVAGLPLHVEYWTSVSDFGNAIIPIWTNKGLPSLLYDLFVGLDDPGPFRILPMPGWLWWATAVASAAGLGACLWGARRWRDHPLSDAIGMCSAVLVAVVAAPVAWAHYFTFLVVPLILWFGAEKAPLGRWLVVVTAAVLLSAPLAALAHRAASEGMLTAAFVGGELLASLVLLVALLWYRQGIIPMRAAEDAGLYPPPRSRLTGFGARAE